jgi:hypothetical protein
MLHDHELKKIILKDSAPELSEDFYARVEQSFKTHSSNHVGEVLVLRGYLSKPKVWALLILALIATVVLLNGAVMHADDDLTKVDALSFSSSLTL